MISHMLDIARNHLDSLSDFNHLGIVIHQRTTRSSFVFALRPMPGRRDLLVDSPVMQGCRCLDRPPLCSEFPIMPLLGVPEDNGLF